VSSRKRVSTRRSRGWVSVRSVGRTVTDVGGANSTPSTSETPEKRPGYSWKMRCIASWDEPTMRILTWDACQCQQHMPVVTLRGE
jgi:hypothetical protein